MDLLWDNGPLTVSEMLSLYAEPKPHFNTVSTMVRSLEKKGFTTHKPEGLSYRYAATMNREQYGQRYLGGVVRDYLDNSYKKVVSQFVENESEQDERSADIRCRFGRGAGGALGRFQAAAALSEDIQGQ